MKTKFTNWYASQVNNQMSAGLSTATDVQIDETARIDKVKVNLNISLLKSQHARWLIEVLKQLATKSNIIKNGF